MAGFGEHKVNHKHKIKLNRNNQMSGETLLRSAIRYHSQGDLFNAEMKYREAIKIGYCHCSIFINLGVICKNSDRKEEAISLYKKAIKIEPEDPDPYSNLGNLYRELSEFKKALSSTLKSLELKPDNPDAHMNLGSIYKDLGNLDQALASTLKSLELKPDNPNVYINLASIYNAQKDFDKAKESYSKAYEYKPSIENACLSKLNFPWHISCQKEVENLRFEYIKNAKAIFNENQPKREKSFLDLSLFMLAYQNGNNDRDFLETVGELVSPWLQITTTQRQSEPETCRYPDRDPKLDKIPRVGFYFDNTEKTHVVFKHYFNIVRNCHDNGIEVVIIKGPLAAKQNSDELLEQSSHVVQLYSNLEQSVETLKSLDLHMLIYTEIYSSYAPYCLAHNRIAPVQAVLPGNLITTGIPTMDYFISSEYMETSTSQEQYTEKLIKLKGMPHGITEIPKFKSTKTRHYFDLPESSHIFSLLHNLIKFHPDWDELLEEIAQNNENAVFMLTGKDSRSSLFLKNRWRQSAPTFSSKCKFFNKMSKENYFNLLACADAVLDPIHMGCGTTSIDALSIGVPIITKPEDHPRTRIAYGLYKIMGIKNAPIAYTKSDYVNFCTKMLSTKQEYIELKESIKMNYSKVAAASQQSINQIMEEIRRLSMPSKIIDANSKEYKN